MQKIGSVFPSVSASQIKKNCRWLNFYDGDDILGWPLRPINSAWQKCVTEDIKIETGSLLSSHTAYLKDRDY